MEIKLPIKVKNILAVLTQNGYEAYAVGGCVRDSLLGRVPEDWDITTSAKPMQVKALFRRTIDTGLQHGTVTVMDGTEGFEVTTYRIDGEYEDGRHPKEVTFTPKLVEDLKRRDFTINAMAYNEAEGLVDCFDGMADLERGVVRCVGNPSDRFHEDALRMLRAVRFAAQLGFEIDPQTADAVRKLSLGLEKISAERIQVELVKLLMSKHPELIREVYRLGISKVILPEFDEMMHTTQNNPHHCYSVGEHTIHGLCHIAPDKVLRLAMLFHDMGKPLCKTTDSKGVDHFHGHPVESERLTNEVMRRLKFDCATMERVSALVRWHDDNPELTPKSVRRALVRVGKEQFPGMFALKRADILAQSTYQREQKLSYVADYERLYSRIMEQKDCLSVRELAVGGNDLMGLGIPQGKRIGELLHRLLELVIEDPQINQRDILLERVRTWMRDLYP